MRKMNDLIESCQSQEMKRLEEIELMDNTHYLYLLGQKKKDSGGTSSHFLFLSDGPTKAIAVYQDSGTIQQTQGCPVVTGKPIF